jgi:DNA adenine methylase
MVDQFMPYLPSRDSVLGKFVEPFLGGAAVFFMVNPEKAVLTDINEELITLYRGIRLCPNKVWTIFKSFPSTKEAYYQIRDDEVKQRDLAFRAARTLYLNRTCFKGMWRHNSHGRFNVGYGGQARRWVIDEDSLIEVSERLRHVDLLCSDFQPVIEVCGQNDFIFADPPYLPGARELIHSHYSWNRFSFAEHVRLASALRGATSRGVRWALTISSHPDILQLYQGYRVIALALGTGKSPGVLTHNPGEVFVSNYNSEVPV